MVNGQYFNAKGGKTKIKITLVSRDLAKIVNNCEMHEVTAFK